MTALSQDVEADLRRRAAELEQKLQSGFAERDEAIAQQAGFLVTVSPTFATIPITVDLSHVELEAGLQEILRQAGIAIGRTRLLGAERNRLAEQRALLDTLADLSGKLEPDKLLQAVLERAVSLLDVSGGELAIFDERSQQLVIVASQNMGTDAVGTRMALGDGARTSPRSGIPWRAWRPSHGV